MRIFVAADVSSKAAVVKLQQEIMATTRWSPNEVRPVERQNFHFTLMFLEEATKEMVGKIIAKLSELRFEPIRLTYSGIGGFPDSDSASTIWIGVDEEGAGKLVKLASEVALKMKEIEIELDKPFIPHFTIFHVKSGRLEIGKSFTKYNGKSFGSDLIDKIHLRKSEKNPVTGQVYSNIFTVNAR